jgi:hypothetical protein
MNTTQAKELGATHLLTIVNGMAPQLYYRLNQNGTLSYYSAYKIWMGSNYNGDEEKLEALKNKLVKIEDYESKN